MRYILKITSRAHPGREDEYDSWYDNVHLGEVLQLPGFIAGERFRCLDAKGEETGLSCTQFTVETDSPGALLQTLFAATPHMQMSDAIDTASVAIDFLRPLKT